jgi:predicted DNA-binding ribbon-helix-helix protein
MAQARRQSLSALVAAVDATRGSDRPLASALRVAALTNEAGSFPAEGDQA